MKQLGLKMDIKDMSLEELREYCISNNLNFLDVLINRETAEKKASKKKDKKLKRKSKKPRWAKDIVIHALDEVRSKHKGRRINLSEFSSYVESDLENEGLSYWENCSLEDFVSKTLYRYAERVKFKTQGFTKNLENQVRAEELEDLLGVNFGSDFGSIAGMLDAEHIRQNYPLSNGRFRNELGEYNIAGEDSWDHEKKEGVREKLLEFAEGYVINKIEIERSEREEELRDEIRAAKQEIEENYNEQTDFRVETPEKGVVITIRKNFIGYLRSRGLIGEDKVRYEMSGNVITFSVDPEVSEEFYSSWQNFKRKHSILLSESKEESVESQKTSRKRKTLENRLKDLGLELGITERRKPRISYLGLEGPNFASYLKLSAFLEESDMEVRATVPEYVHRNANLMKSICNSGISRAFDDVEVVEGNVDDLILLDFAKDSNLKVVYRKDRKHIKYKDERLSIDEYHALLDEIDSEGSTPSHLSVKYGISDSFVAAASDRIGGKFDVVFLDYYKSFSDKTKSALELLLKRRTGDKVVVATTLNLNPKRNGEISTDEVPGFNFENMVTSAEDSGYEVLDFEEETYKIRQTPMYFSVYALEKRKDK